MTILQELVDHKVIITYLNDKETIVGTLKNFDNRGLLVAFGEDDNKQLVYIPHTQYRAITAKKKDQVVGGIMQAFRKNTETTIFD